ncbi:hypothetical protein KXV32_005700, partial [Aspergillus fumigatus]
GLSQAQGITQPGDQGPGLPALPGTLTVPLAGELSGGGARGPRTTPRGCTARRRMDGIGPVRRNAQGDDGGGRRTWTPDRDGARHLVVPP